MSKPKIIRLIISKYKKIKKHENRLCSGIVVFETERKKLGLISLYIHGIRIDSSILSFRSFTFSKYN